MICYVLEKGKRFRSGAAKKAEISDILEKEIDGLCIKWQVRSLSEHGYFDDAPAKKLYESLKPEAFVVSDGKIVGYYAVHYDVCKYVSFPFGEKARLGSYDYSDYTNGTGKVDRGHVDIVPNPDTDSNPYHDLPRFHSQEEYDDYIKWRD